MLKGRENVLRVYIQRKKRYKGTAIPGFKTLGNGTIDLDQAGRLSRIASPRHVVQVLQRAASDQVIPLNDPVRVSTRLRISLTYLGLRPRGGAGDGGVCEHTPSPVHRGGQQLRRLR